MSNPETEGGPVASAANILQITLNEDGVVIGITSSNVLQPNAIAVSAEAFALAQANLGRARWTDDEIVPFEPPGPPLEEVKAQLKAQVDADAERARLGFITPGAGQAMTYQAKTAEALRLQDDANPLAEAYPLLAAEIDITAPTLAEVGATVLAAYQQWLTIGAAIEAARLGAKRAIDEAQDEAAARAVTPVWP